MSDVLVIGYGNPLRGDDGVGWHVVEELKHISRDEDIQYLTVQQLGPELAEVLSTTSNVIFIDGSIGDTPGEITRMDIHPMKIKGPLDHHVTPETLLSFTQSLYGNAANGTLYAVNGKVFDFNESLSPVVEETIPVLAKEILWYVHELEERVQRSVN